MRHLRFPIDCVVDGTAISHVISRLVVVEEWKFALVTSLRAPSLDY